MKSKNQSPLIRPINKNDVLSFNDNALYDRSLRGLAVELNGETIAIAGVLHTVPLQVFSLMKDEMRQYPVMIMKTAKRLTQLMRKYDAPLVARADEDEHNSDAFLQRLGFELIGENEDGRFYVCQAQ